MQRGRNSLPAGKKRWVQSWGLAEEVQERGEPSSSCGASAECALWQQTAPGAGEAYSTAWIVAVWMPQVTSRKEAQDQRLRAENREQQKLGKMLQGGSISSQHYRKEKSLEAAEQSLPPGRTGKERTWWEAAASSFAFLMIWARSSSTLFVQMLKQHKSVVKSADCKPA